MTEGIPVISVHGFKKVHYDKSNAEKIVTILNVKQCFDSLAFFISFTAGRNSAARIVLDLKILNPTK
jgi:hypothetical protein